MPVKWFWLGIMLVGLSAAAQENAPSGFLRGELVSWTGTPRAGQFTFHIAPDRLYSCSYDEKSYIERDHERISFRLTERGDRLEVLSDRKPGSAVCYARILHVVDVAPTYIVPGVRPR